MYCFFNAADCLRNRRRRSLPQQRRWHRRRHMDADAAALASSASASNQRCMWDQWTHTPTQTCGRNMLILR